MIKLAMMEVRKTLGKSATRMLLQVHDELVFEVGKKAVKRASELIAREMKNALPLTVPVEVEIGAGPNWLEAH